MGGSLLYSYTPAVYTGGGSEYPINYYKLGIPAPTNKPTAILVSAAPTDDVSASARSYVYTYIGKLGEESAPSPPSDFLICPNAGAVVNLSNLIYDTSTETGREIVSLRIYRTIVGSTGNADYLFLKEVPKATPTWIPITSYFKESYVIPPTPDGFRYLCVKTGISGATEPNWADGFTVGLDFVSLINDGTCKWTRREIATLVDD